jgi:Holliday junction resolvase RusA-like endonuclease
MKDKKKLKTIIIIDGIVDGMNGSEGLIRESFKAAKRKKIKYGYIIRSQTKNRHPGQVVIRYIGYKSALMDWDNFAASFKHIGDALVKCGVIVDDSPKFVRPFKVEQIKVPRKDQRVEIIIEDL